MDSIADKKTTLLTDDNFSKLRDAQRTIQEKTDLSPSLRLFINDVINDTSVELSINRFIEKIEQMKIVNN